LVKVSSTAGGKVPIEIHGINETKMFLQAKRKIVLTASDAGVLRAANFVEQEVQESIIGNRSEPKSVRTGRFGNSIRVDKIRNAAFKVYPEKVSYPGGNVTTEDVAKMLEYGTTTIMPRRHFRNTESRNKGKVKEIIEKEIINRLKRDMLSAKSIASKITSVIK